MTRRLTSDEVRQVFEPIMLREARDRLDSLFEICRVLDAAPGQDIEMIRAALTKALIDRDSVVGIDALDRKLERFLNPPRRLK